MNRMNYPYAYVVDGIVQSVSLFYTQATESHPFYNSLVPLREYDPDIIGYRYISLNDEGYGIFEPVEDTPNEEAEAQTEEKTEV